MKTRFLLAICMSILASYSYCQNPVRWNYSVKKVSPGLYEIQMTAIVSENWHIFSQNTPEGGPFPTTINFTANPLIEKVGNPIEEGKKIVEFQEVFGVSAHFYEKKLVLKQLVKIKGKAKTAISGSVEYMACNDTHCLPPRKSAFSILLE